ncbi:MAG: ribosome assembly RNA-binding protein YhbY [Gammaproteobacteria bacterium]|nr:ribosome assembly RNA-binding protein YhbY [Gammaproteobacteria bacterium]
MSLSEKQRRHLRKLAHDLKPLVIIGQAGLTENVVTEIDSTLAHHELIKVRLNAGDKSAKQAMIDEILQQTGADWVLSIGHICAIYRPAEKPKIELPK